MYEHKDKLVPGFASKYNLTWLAYYEETSDVMSAIEGEKEIKGWRRSKKMALVESMNPKWRGPVAGVGLGCWTEGSGSLRLWAQGRLWLGSE